MKIVNTGNTYMVYGDDLKTYDRLPVGTYEVGFNMMTGFFLTRKDDIGVSEKVYGSHEAKADKILKSFKATSRNLGVILSGNKGIGKSMTAKIIAMKAIQEGLPVIVVNNCLKGVAGYISEIKQECVVLFDEFDKTFKVKHGSRGNDGDGGDQDEFLTLFDGIDQGKRLFIVTCNSLYDLSDYLVNRPGRFHYHLRFDYPSVEEIREYLQDKLDEKYWWQIDDVIKFSGMTDLNYDCLRAIAFELNLGTPFNEAIKDLNITSYENDYEYDVTCILSNGMRSVRKNRNVNTNSGIFEMSFSFPALHDSVYVELDTSIKHWDNSDFEEYCGEDSFTDVRWSRGKSSNVILNQTSAEYPDYPECADDDEDDEGDEKEKARPTMPRVVKVTFKRKSGYHNIHYAF